MTVDQLRNVCTAKPYQPFTIHLADGRDIYVRHPDFIITVPSGRTAIVYQPDDSFNIVDLRLVTALEVVPGSSGSGTASPA
jgi:hypothetical protein